MSDAESAPNLSAPNLSSPTGEAPGAGDIRRRLFDLSGAAARTYASRVKIIEAAEARLADVRGRLEELRPRAATDAAAGAEYEALTEEVGRLDLVLAR